MCKHTRVSAAGPFGVYPVKLTVSASLVGVPFHPGWAAWQGKKEHSLGSSGLFTIWLEIGTGIEWFLKHCLVPSKVTPCPVLAPDLPVHTCSGRSHEGPSVTSQQSELVLNMNGSFMNHRGKRQSWERTDVDTTCWVCLERKRQSEVRRDQLRPRSHRTQVTERTRVGGRAGGQPGEGLGHIPRHQFSPWRPPVAQRSVYVRRWWDCACVLEWRVYGQEETMGTGRSINSAK